MDDLKNKVRTKNLPPHLWKPGQSGNPAGRPKSGQALTDLFREYLNGTEGEGKTKAERKRLLVEALYKRAVGFVDADGNPVPGSDILLKYAIDRLDGKPDTTVHVDDGEIPQVVITGPVDGAE